MNMLVVCGMWGGIIGIDVSGGGGGTAKPPEIPIGEKAAEVLKSISEWKTDNRLSIQSVHQLLLEEGRKNADKVFPSFSSVYWIYFGTHTHEWNKNHNEFKLHSVKCKVKLIECLLVWRYYWTFYQVFLVTFDELNIQDHK